MSDGKGIKITRRKVLAGIGVGAFVASNVALLGYCGFFGFLKKEEPKTVEFTFTGPIKSYEKLMEQPFENSWIRVDGIGCWERRIKKNKYPDSFSMSFAFNDPKIEKIGVSPYKIHSKVIITDKNGTSKDMIDEMIEYQNEYFEIAGRGTYSPLRRGGVHELPYKLPDIEKIQVQFTRIDIENSTIPTRIQVKNEVPRGPF
ncbi:MAG: hypothetical protein IT426_13270 [Pirellulales bacterium]|nr:hypothetical protein [Pirellulales bacterium]